MSLGSFVAGMVLGLAMPDLIASGPVQHSSDQDYIRDMVSRYDLTSAQQRQLAMILLSEREAERTILSSAEWTQLPPALLNRLLEARGRTKARIRQVLDERQRQVFDQESQLPQRGGAAPDQRAVNNR